VYAIEANEDVLYVWGSAATGNIWSYTISTNTSAVLTAGGRASTANTTSLHHVDKETDPSWLDESNYLNGRYLYSFRGNTTAFLDRYDLATRTWEAVPYAGSGTTFLFTHETYIDGNVYVERSTTGAWFRYNVAKNVLEGIPPCSTTGTADLAASNACSFSYADPITGLRVYCILHAVIRGTVATPVMAFQVIPLCPTYHLYMYLSLLTRRRCATSLGARGPVEEVLCALHTTQIRSSWCLCFGTRSPRTCTIRALTGG
jgi:hypothetical protein